MSDIDFERELLRLREEGRSSEELGAFAKNLCRAIGELAKELQVQVAQGAELERELNAAAAEEEALVKSEQSGSDLEVGLLELFDAASFNRWIAEAARIENALMAPGRLVTELEQTKEFMFSFAADASKFKALLSLPLQNPEYREALEQLVLCENKVHKLLLKFRDGQ